MASLIKNELCFLPPASDLEIEKVLIWKTKVTFENEMRQSSYFSLMGLEWCLRFSFYSRNVGYHVITLHQVIDGKVLLSSDEDSKVQLNKKFVIKTSLKNVQTIPESSTNVVYPLETLWHTQHQSYIYQYIPNLYNRPEISVVCKFDGQPLSAFRLQIIKDNSCELDKCIQVSTEVPHLGFQALSNDFSDLLEKEILPDVKLECSGQTLQAHKSILVARSSVFRAMFQNKMLESETGAVKICDIDAATLLKLVKFLYSGKLEDLSENNMEDLYLAADKYHVISLKIACSYWMMENLSESNCINILKIASSHSDSDLKNAAISFIVKNPHVMMSASWLSLSKELPFLAIEVFQTHITSSVASHCNQTSFA